MTPEDFLCDFCLRPYTGDRVMIEGHRGSLICVACLSGAYLALRDQAPNPGAHPPETVCTLCLEKRGTIDALWPSPLRAEAVICGRCAMQSIETLEADEEVGFVRPV